MFVVSVMNFIFRIYSDRLNESFLIECKLVLVLLVGVLAFSVRPNCPEGMTPAGCIHKLLLPLN